MNAASVVSSKLLAGGRAATQLAIIPAVLVPVWLLGISAFSTIGLLPAGATALALVSWVFLRNYASISKNTELSREIASKLASNFLIVSAVSLLFLVFQIIVWLFATQFSPTLGTIIFMINHLPAETLSSEPKCNTPADLIIGTVDQDLRECCHAMLFAFVG